MFALALCLTLYGLVMLGSVWAPVFLGGPKIKPLVSWVLMPMDLVMLGWNQRWQILLLHLGTTVAAFAVSKSNTDHQYNLMLVAFFTCAAVTAVNDAIKAYRHPPKMDHKSH